MVRTRRSGIVVVLVATVLWSTAGLFVHMAALDRWSVVAWRSLFAVGTLGPFWFAATRNKARALRSTCSPPGVVAVLLGVVSGISYVVSLQMTAVANVMTVYATLPFITSAMAFFALRERATVNFVVCGVAASLGVAVMTRTAVTADDTIGIVAAFVMTAGFAASLVQAKKYPLLDMTLVTVAAAAISGLFALPSITGIFPEARQILACALLGAVTTGLANVMSLVGGRLIRSGEAGLLSLLDVVLGPLWVWWAFDERVSRNTLIGGSIVMLAVVGYLLRSGTPRAAACSARSRSHESLTYLRRVLGCRVR